MSLLLAFAELAVVTTTEAKERHPFQTEKCHVQLSKMKMDSCRQHLQPEMLFSRMNMGQILQKCCGELEKVIPDCRCEAIKQTARSCSISQGEEREKQMQEVMRKAQQLPGLCGMPQYCQLDEPNPYQTVRS
ncbi:hypothetical protein ACHQM5_007578 [Ranunculus cassubicifolius]